AAGGSMHGVQMWLALPLEREDDAPSFEHHPEASLPAIAPAAGAQGRVLIGAAFGATSPIQHPSQPWLVDVELDADAELEVESGVAERGVLVIEGAVHLGDAPLAVNQLAVLSSGACPRLRADTAARLLLVGGPPIGPRLIEWNFVASTQDRIDRASADWKARRFPSIPTDDREFIPLPGTTAGVD
ncbi:MAG TPA: pirin-like C-terminal cupin domain-containing protein, partial [Kofleriaceae bacterium]|nr:pirin-like C-terminal cupin domain-containing protein [Kofleriaceae bacterium]